MKLFEMIDVNYGIKAGHPGAMFTIGDVYGNQNLNVPHAKLNVQNKNKKKMGIPESMDPTDEAQFINALRDLLPIAMAQLEIEKLPKIKLEKYVDDAEQPTFGRFVNNTLTIHIGIENRHIIDILRTLAHELVHFKQHELGELGPESGRTGSPAENEAHAVAGVIMRHFNLKHPEYFHDPAISLEEAAKVRLSTDPSNFGAYVSDTGSHEEKTVKIPVHKIDVFEPDAKFDEPKYAKNLKKIVNAIKAGKTLPPILVRRMPGLRYQVLDGHHRFKAYRLAGVKSIPARIVAPANVKVDENLRDWFGKEKWVRMDTKGNIKGDCARGSEKEGKPKCLPQAKAHALGKKGRASAAQKKRREDPNPDRKGAAINVSTKVREETVDEACWKGYHKDGMKTMFGKRYPNCVKNKNESLEVYVNKGECPGCGGVMVSEDQMNEKKDACYHKVKSRYKVWPSAYASGALVQCRKKGASNWGNKSESVTEGPKDYDSMNLDSKGRQESLDYFYHEHAPSFGKPKLTGRLGNYQVVTFVKGDTTLMFLVDQKEQPVFYVAFEKYEDGVAIGNVRSNGSVRATEVYKYLIDKYKTLYSDEHQTPDGRKIWKNLSSYPELEVADVGDRLMARVKHNEVA